MSLPRDDSEDNPPAEYQGSEWLPSYEDFRSKIEELLPDLEVLRRLRRDDPKWHDIVSPYVVDEADQQSVLQGYSLSWVEMNKMNFRKRISRYLLRNYHGLVEFDVIADSHMPENLWRALYLSFADEYKVYVLNPKEDPDVASVVAQFRKLESPT